MEKRHTILEIGEDALEILDRLMSGDTDTIKSAMEDRLRLVDRFYGENEEMIVSSQYEAAKKDVEYFLRLVYLAVEYYRSSGCGKFGVHFVGDS